MIRFPRSLPSRAGRRSVPRLLLALACSFLLGSAAAVLPRAAAAQNVVVDQGTFLLSRNGQAIGTESFTIRQSGAGASSKLVATGDVTLNLDGQERTISSALEATGPESVITAYQLKEGGASQSEIYMTLSGRRFQARVVTEQGEQVREYRAAPRIVLLEQWLAHHYFLLARRATGGSASLPVLVPRSGQQMDIRIADTGTEGIQIAGQSVQARHLRVEGPDVERDVWVDAQGRILRLIDRNTGFRAERRDLPD